jgi:hypothetical protein
MTAALHDGDIEVALVLTEGAVLDILKGGDNRLVGIYVESPFVWGIHVAANGPADAERWLAGVRWTNDFEPPTPALERIKTALVSQGAIDPSITIDEAWISD